MSIETSIIIRTKNEERWLGRVLQKLVSQTYKNFEIIIVDSGSGDRTLEIARKFPVRIFEIPPASFSYPYALNYGAERATAEKFMVILSAHSLPVSNAWLSDGLSHFRDVDTIAGVYGPLCALPDATFWDKLFQESRHFLDRAQEVEIKMKPGLGVLGFTNAIVRKNLWQLRKFEEAYGAGGEDGEWAAYWMARGYKVIKDKKFSVMHSHYLSLRGWRKQLAYWRSLNHPRPFVPLDFRKTP